MSSSGASVQEAAHGSVSDRNVWQTEAIKGTKLSYYITQATFIQNVNKTRLVAAIGCVSFDQNVITTAASFLEQDVRRCFLQEEQALRSKIITGPFEEESWMFYPVTCDDTSKNKSKFRVVRRCTNTLRTGAIIFANNTNVCNFTCCRK